MCGSIKSIVDERRFRQQRPQRHAMSRRPRCGTAAEGCIAEAFAPDRPRALEGRLCPFAVAVSSRTTAAGQRLVILNRALHTGDIFGMPSKVAVSLASLAIVAQFVTGLVMWRKRAAQQRRAKKTFAAAP